jgi:phage major head subunit gpT-like protein
MAVPLTSANFSDVLDPRFREVAMGTYDKGKSRIPDLFGVKDSDRVDERYSSLTPMGKFQTFVGAISYDGAEQEYDVTATHVEKALGLEIQRKLYDDDQFGVIDEQFEGLGLSAFKTHEDDAANMFVGSFSNASDFFSHTESVAWCSNSHTTPVSGVSTSTGFDNLITSVLDPVSLDAAVVQFRGFKDAAGDRIDQIPNLLIVPVNLRSTADEIIGSQLKAYETSNTRNVYEGKFQVYDWSRLTDSNDWWVADSEGLKRNCLWFWRVRLELARMEMFETISARGRGYMRYSMLRRDWRNLLGSQVS